MSGGAREQRICARFAIVTRVHLSVAEVVGWERWLVVMVVKENGIDEWKEGRMERGVCVDPESITSGTPHLTPLSIPSSKGPRSTS